MGSNSLPRSMAVIGDALGPRAAVHMDLAFRRVLKGSGVTAEPGYIRLLTGEPHPLANFVIVSDPADIAVFERAIDPLVGATIPASVFVPGTVTSELAARLEHAGFAAHGAIPAMAVDIDTLAPTSLPDGYTFARVAAGPDSDEWTEAFAVGYGLPRVAAGLFSPNAAQSTDDPDADLQFFAVRRDGRIVCNSVVYLADGVAGIYCVATLPEERGQGLGAHATAEPLRQLRTHGYGVGVLQSSEAGHSVYRKLGFADVGSVAIYVRMPG